jgi:hypothetical protein
MMRSGLGRVWMAVLVLAAGLLAPASRAVTAEQADIDQMIATAKTAADHQALADYYTRQAAEARAQVATHKKMAAQYSMSSVGKQATKTHFHQHCEALIRSYEAEAKEYDALAKAHHDMAVEAGK